MNAYATITHDAPQRRIHHTKGMAVLYPAARALDDCGVIRARYNAKGYARLAELGLATSRPAGNWKADFRLTGAGRAWIASTRRAGS